eukprot:gene3997-2848_t
MKSGSAKLSAVSTSIKQSGTGVATTAAPSGAARTIQEQLRADHIEALAEITRLSKENEELQKQVDALRLTQAKSPNQEDSSPQNLAQELKRFRESNVALTSENNRLKEQVRRVSADEKQKCQELLARQSADSTVQIRRLQEQVKDLETHNGQLHEQLLAFESSVASSEESTESLRRRVQLLQIQCDDGVASLNERDHALTFANQEILTLQGQCQALQQNQTDEQLRRSEDQRQMDQLRDQLRSLQQSFTAQTATLSSFEHDNEQLRFALQQAQAKVHTLQAQVPKAATAAAPQLYGDSDSDDDDVPAAVPLKPVAAAKETQSTQTDLSAVHQSLAVELETVEEHLPGDDETLAPHTVRFQEFLRLKRENRELKLRLADRDLQSQTRANRGPHMLSSSKSNGAMARSVTTPTLPRLVV